MLTGPALYLIAAAGGLCVGSFLHTCIHRLPRGLSVLRPRSACAHCGETLGAGELVPLWSYLAQGGRCRRCGGKIDPLCFWVEAGAGALAAASLWAEGASPAFFRTFALAAVLLAVAVVDARHRIIPNAFVGAGLVISFLGAPWGVGPSAPESAAGLAAAGGGFALVKILYRRIRGREGMGAGDVKLAALIGAALGVSGWLQATLLGSVAGVAVGVALILRGRANWQTALSYGAFLSGGAIAVLLSGGFLPR